MIYKYEYTTPNKFDDIILLSDREYLTGLLYTSEVPKGNYEIKELSIFLEIKKYLDIYFSGKIPDFTPSHRVIGTNNKLIGYGGKINNKKNY